MVQGMTGFGSAENVFPKIGMVRVEIRSTNHKFLETVLHVPEGLISVEDKIKKAIETIQLCHILIGERKNEDKNIS